MRDGSEGTLVIVRVFSVPSHHSESARIAFARSCDDPRARLELALAPVREGVSRSALRSSANELLARRAIVEVFRSTRRGLERVSCGELRR